MQSNAEILKMVQINGTYQLVKNENFGEYMKAIGIPDEIASKATSMVSKYEVAVDGKKISVKNDSGLGGPLSDFVYVIGEEVEEKMPSAKIVLKSTAKLDGDTITITSTAPNGQTGTRIYKFSDTEMVVSLTAVGNATTAKRYFKRI